MRTYTYMDRGPGEAGFQVWLREDGKSMRSCRADTLDQVYRIGEEWKRAETAAPYPTPSAARRQTPARAPLRLMPARA